MMLSLTTSCPKCRHVFPLGACAGAPPGCRERRSLSGGSLLQQRAPKPRLAPPRPPPSPDSDIQLLSRVVARLRLSGWYYEELTWQASQRALRDRAPGTFLVRDSGDHKFLYSLSVQTAKGPTSVRLFYSGGLFRLDAEAAHAPLMPQFDCVVKLVEHYVRVTEARASGRAGLGHVWVDASGGQHSPVEVRAPLRLKACSLKHAARLAVHRALRAAAPPQLALLPPLRRLGLPACLQDYLAEYPYTC